jgi:TM2 domain-containing membrane protein YozV
MKRKSRGAGRRDRQKVDGRKKPRPVWVVTLCAFVLPGSGQVLNGDPIRGIIMQFFMLLGGFLTYQVAGPDISIIGRLAGGIAVYVFSVIDANGIAKRRARAWERIVSEPKPGPHARPDERPAAGRGSSRAGAGGARPVSTKPASSEGKENDRPGEHQTPGVAASQQQRRAKHRQALARAPERATAAVPRV